MSAGAKGVGKTHTGSRTAQSRGQPSIATPATWTATPPPAAAHAWPRRTQTWSTPLQTGLTGALSKDNPSPNIRPPTRPTSRTGGPPRQATWHRHPSEGAPPPGRADHPTEDLPPLDSSAQGAPNSGVLPHPPKGPEDPPTSSTSPQPALPTSSSRPTTHSRPTPSRSNTPSSCPCSRRPSRPPLPQPKPWKADLAPPPTSGRLTNPTLPSGQPNQAHVYHPSRSECGGRT